MKPSTEKPDAKDLECLQEFLLQEKNRSLPVFAGHPDKIIVSEKNTPLQVSVISVEAYQSNTIEVVRYPKSIAKSLKIKFP